jgi:hypothetical protein
VLSYGLECPCHGVRVFATALDRDAAAIAYQCKARFFRVREKESADGVVVHPADVL